MSVLDQWLNKLKQLLEEAEIEEERLIKAHTAGTKGYYVSIPKNVVANTWYVRRLRLRTRSDKTIVIVLPADLDP